MLRKHYAILFALSFLFSSPAFAVTGNSPSQQQASLKVVKKTYGASSAEDFLSLTPQNIEKHSGEKLDKQAVKQLKKDQKKLKKASAGGKKKSQIAALLLCIFFGGLGIHRFYLGYTLIGIIQLLTLGGLGIWALIDLIMIITGDLKPADGSNYDPSF